MTWEEDVRKTCQQLVPPLLLATPSGWRLVEDEEATAGAGDSAQQRVVRNAKAVTEWVQSEAPDKLRRLSRLVDRGNEDDDDDDKTGSSSTSDISLQIKALIATTAARFISPRKRSNAETFSINAWTNDERSLWTSPENEQLARQILQQPMLLSSTRSDDEGKRTARFLQMDIVDSLLQSYLRPLFSTTPATSINEATGRARKANNKPTAGGAPLEDEVIWKGGDLKRAQQMRLQGNLVVASEHGGQDVLQARHSGLGCEGVFYICCLAINHVHEDENDAWSQYWAQILPPLLQLLEDPSPRFRLAGTRILSETLLSDSRDPKRQIRVGTLLLRTGVAQIFRQALEASLTFISGRLAGALLQSTAEAWLSLISVTTDELSATQGRSAHALNLDADGGRARFEGLSKLIDDGVLRVWAYAPTSMTSYDLEDLAVTPTIREPVGETRERGDVIDASIAILVRMTSADALGVGIVRYLDVTLEFLTQQLLDIEGKVERAKQKGADSTYRLSLERQVLAAEAIEALINVCTACPAIEPWCARCVTSATRCWLVLQETNDDGARSSGLLSRLGGIIDALHRAKPDRLQHALRHLLELDRTTFTPFLGPHLVTVQ